MKVLPPVGPERTRQITRLALLLVVLAGVLWWRLAPGVPTAAPATGPGVSGARSAGQPSPGQLPVPAPVRLDSLGAAAEATDVVRNPFGFGQRETVSPPGSAFLTPPGPAEPAPFVSPVPQGPPPVPLQLTGLTVLESGGRTLVTLKDPAANVLYQAYEGDIVDGRYRVVKVGVQSVVVSYLDGSGTRTLPLGG